MSTSLLTLLPTSKYGYKGQKPANFDLGPNSPLHDTSSLNGIPPFAGYSDATLRTLKPTKLSRGNAPIVKYLDNPPH